MYEDVVLRFKCGDCDAGELLRADGGPRHGTMKWVLWCEEIRTYIRHLGCILLVPRYKLMCRKNL